jgi:hypothetical protein
MQEILGRQIAYRFEDSRGGKYVERHLAGFAGILEVDGYAAYNRLAMRAGANEGVALAACFAYVRRQSNLRLRRHWPWINIFACPEYS